MHDLHFPFELLPLEDVQPWGTPESGLSLSWYGLTNGWYDVVVGEQRLFSTPDGDPRGIDYQVARLWEDLLAATPFVLEPLPGPLAARARRGDAWARWDRDTREAADALGEVAELAVAWWSHRTVGSYHLRGAPDMNLWRDGDDLHVRWRSIPIGADAPVWCSPDGDALVAVQRFCDELARFDRDLIAAMQVRVDAIASGRLRPDIAIDVAALHAEQADRATYLRSAITVRPGGLPRWDDVTERCSRPSTASAGPPSTSPDHRGPPLTCSDSSSMAGAVSSKAGRRIRAGGTLEPVRHAGDAAFAMLAVTAGTRPEARSRSVLGPVLAGRSTALALVLLGGCFSVGSGSTRPRVMPMLSELPADPAKRDAILDSSTTIARPEQRKSITVARPEQGESMTVKERKAETAASTAAAIIGGMFSKTQNVTLGAATMFDEGALAPLPVSPPPPGSTDKPDDAANRRLRLIDQTRI